MTSYTVQERKKTLFKTWTSVFMYFCRWRYTKYPPRISRFMRPSNEIGIWRLSYYRKWLSKHVQILMFVFSIFLFFSSARYDIMHLNFAFYSKTMSTCGIDLWAFFNTSSDEPGYAGFKWFWWNTVFFKLWYNM